MAEKCTSLPRMRVLLRNTSSRQYLGDASWVSDQKQAIAFPNCPKAIAASCQLGVDALEMVLTFEGGPSYDISIPLGVDQAVHLFPPDLRL
jgi:hypothetical protein